MHGKPIVVLDVAGFFEPLWKYLADLSRRGFVRQAAVDVVYRTDSVDDAFAELERRVG
jgi:predicted Rossmann-fold nucleotide-binding protein